MTKAELLLEKVKDVSADSQSGKYTVEFDVTKDLSDEVRRHPHSDDDEFADDILSDIVHYYQKILSKEVWDSIRHTPGVSGCDVNLEFQNKTPDVKTLDDVMKVLKTAAFRVTVEIATDLDTNTKVEVDNEIKKVLEK